MKRGRALVILPSGFKRCSSCGEIRPVTLFTAHRYSSDGLRSNCKLCVVKGRKKVEESLDVGWRRCVTCDEVQPVEVFDKHVYGPGGRRSTCKGCRSQKRRKDPVPEGKKRCTSCRKVKPRTFFYKKADSVTSRCRDCLREAARTLRGVEAEERRAERARVAALVLSTGLKTCVSCEVEKSVEDFWKRADSADGCASSCRLCMAARRARPDPEDEERVDRWKGRRSAFDELVDQVKEELGV